MSGALRGCLQLMEQPIEAATRIKMPGMPTEMTSPRARTASAYTLLGRATAQASLGQQAPARTSTCCSGEEV